MYFSPTTECEIFDAIQQLNFSKNDGFYRIFLKFIRIAAVILTPVLKNYLMLILNANSFQTL